MPELKVSIVEYSLAPESGILRQNQQDNLPQVGCLRGDNIFSFA